MTNPNTFERIGSHKSNQSNHIAYSQVSFTAWIFVRKRSEATLKKYKTPEIIFLLGRILEAIFSHIGNSERIEMIMRNGMYISKL